MAPHSPEPLHADLEHLAHASRALDPDAPERETLRAAVVASMERFLGEMGTRRAYQSTPDNGARLLDAPIGASGLPIDDVIGLLEREVIRPGANPGSGGHLAYIPGGGLYHAALGDYIAAITNKYAGVFFAGPGAVRMENMLLRWVADLVGLPATAGGNLTSGGSIANLTAITAARDAHGLRGADYASAVVYLTSQAHHCIDKALRIAGMAEAVVRYIPMDAGYRMRPEQLTAQIAADRAAGLRPWLVIASAGTTDTGAVDPLDDIADVAAAERCWYHVDAAYGGFFLLTAHGRAALAGIARADSVVLDPHKSLFLPYGSGVLLVRDVATLVATHAYDANYMQDAVRDESERSPADVSAELTKHFRALRMWLPLMLVGTRAFEAALDEKLLLARYFRREVAALGYEVGPETALSIVTFRWAPPGVPLDEANRLNATIVERMREDGRIFLSSTMLDGRYTLRMVSLAFRTHRATIDLALTILREQAAALG